MEHQEINMDFITSRALTAQLVVTGFVVGAFDRLRKDERGQGSVEYLGIILVVVAIIAIVAGAATPVGTAIKTKIIEAINGM